MSEQPPPPATTPEPEPEPAPQETQQQAPEQAEPKATRARRFAGHRATQLVAVGLLGLILGGGIVALADRDDDRRGGPGFRDGHDRGHSRPFDRFDDRRHP